ncbi:MAG TPA: tetratricopeptide repeat protein [Gemmatimonadaceae bacterium]|nr:tetratricopeptide repeat protein [Gemmatimonadaceae bacterium]
MRLRRARLSLVLLVVAPALAGQRATPIPPRPKLYTNADTNDAHAYYLYGVQELVSNPEGAKEGFYWASQIDPTSAEALYAMQTASLMALSSSTLYDYYDYAAKKRKPEFVALDSLLFRAYAINPFLYRSLDRSLIRHLIQADMKAEHPNVNGATLNLAILEYEQQRRHAAAWESYAEGHFPEALDTYAKQLKDMERTKTRRNNRDHEDDACEIHAERARIFYILGNFDSSLTEMAAAIAGLHERDAKETVILYESKAMYDQSLGMIHEKTQHMDLAREAYARALEEDLSYFTAHTKMAMLQLAQGDTTSALTELDLAVQLQPSDPVLRYTYAMALIQSRRDADAVKQLLKSIALDPFYAAPRLLLARIADAEQYTDDAVREYGEYVALAPKSDPQLAAVRSRVSTLQARVASSSTPATSTP